jgi:predicted amidophosphoribosyltransferase
MDHLLLVGKTLARARSAVLLLANSTIGRSIAHFGLGSGNATFRWPRADLPYNVNESQIVQNITDVRMARAIRAIFGDVLQGAFIRIPVLVENDFACSMLFNLPQGVATPSKTEMLLLRSLAKQMAKTARPLIDHFIASGSPISIAASSAELVEAVSHDEGLRVILDHDMRVVAVSDTFLKFGRKQRSEIVGKSYYDLNLPISRTMGRLYEHAIESGLSTPEVEISSEMTGELRRYRVRATPIRASDCSEDWLDIVVVETASMPLEAEDAAGADGFEEARSMAVDATAEFLFNTLVRKRSIRSRGETNFVTVRAWRSSIKQFQIKALRAVKRGEQEGLARLAGAECAGEVDRLVGIRTFKFVVPVPCGHSAPGACFSGALAKAVAAELDVPVINAFAHMGLKGSSHPKSNIKRPAMKLVQSVPGPALLIDDVATSGAHLAEASALLKQEGTESFAVAWIGGDSA